MHYIMGQLQISVSLPTGFGLLDWIQIAIL